MNRPAQVFVAALLLCSGPLARSSIKPGEFDPISPQQLNGYRTCIPSQADPQCGLLFGYSVDGPETMVVLSELSRKLEPGPSEFRVVDVVSVTEELRVNLRIHCRYRGVVDSALLASVEFKGEPDRWVGPAAWAVAVDPDSRRIVHRDPAFVECFFEKPVE